MQCPARLGDNNSALFWAANTFPNPKYFSFSTNILKLLLRNLCASVHKSDLCCGKYWRLRSDVRYRESVTYSLVWFWGVAVCGFAAWKPMLCLWKNICITNHLESFIYVKISHSKSGKFYHVICEKAGWVKCPVKPRHHCWLWSSQWIKWPLHFLGLGLKPRDCNSLVPAAVSLTMQWDSIR